MLLCRYFSSSYRNSIVFSVSREQVSVAFLTPKFCLSSSFLIRLSSIRIDLGSRLWSSTWSAFARLRRVRTSFFQQPNLFFSTGIAI